ncbi:MAG TPA: hypothetical protein VFI31_29955 [Pirellulales bacterium]|nr:hypothetical protein [Pirellulales bacterium]
MRTAVVLAAVVSGSFLVASHADAQVSYVYGGSLYPVTFGAQPLASGGYGGVYSQQNYGWQYGGYPLGGYLGRPYVGPVLQPWNGLVNGGLTYLPQTPVNNNPYYGGYTRYAQYGLRRSGGGRTFGTYVPRDYRVYQPRPGGLFDR